MHIVRFGVGEDDYRLWDDVMENHAHLTTPGVRMLYMTRRKDRGETSLILDVTDCDAMGDLVLEMTRMHPHIRTVSTVSLMKPMFFPVPSSTPRMERFTVTIGCDPNKCKGVYGSLKGIRPTKQNVITYLAYIFADGNRSMIMSVLSRSRRSLEEFIEDKVTPLEGVTGTEATRIIKTHKLVSTDEWKQRVKHLTVFEFLESEEFDDSYLTDIIAGS